MLITGTCTNPDHDLERFVEQILCEECFEALAVRIATLWQRAAELVAAPPPPPPVIPFREVAKALEGALSVAGRCRKCSPRIEVEKAAGVAAAIRDLERS